MKDIIKQKILDAKKRFDEVQANLRAIEISQEELKTRKQQLNVEAFQLQGEFRVLESLVDIDKQESSAQPETPLKAESDVK